jgi:hypothetical protein
MLLPKPHSAVTLVLLLVISAAAFAAGRRTAEFDEITVKKITVVDDEGRTRVLLAGGYGPRRADLAGLLFINEEGVEAGGLVYTGKRDTAGSVNAGAILTFDQFGNDQIVALSYDQDGGRKRQGLTIQDRPDSLTERLKEAYRAVESATSEEERDSLVEHYFSRIPRREIAARRLFVGRSWNQSSLVTLSDPDGRARLRLEVDSLGAARIQFLDDAGDVVRSITP